MSAPTNEIDLLDDDAFSRVEVQHSRGIHLLDVAALGTLTPWQRGGQMYLATPYTKPATGDDGIDWRGAEAMCSEALFWLAYLTAQGLSVVSPIALAHPAARVVRPGHVPLRGAPGEVPLPCFLDPLDTSFWTRWCAPILRASRGVIVPPIPGWRESEGIAHEVAEAVEAGKPVWTLIWKAAGATVPVDEARDGRAPSHGEAGTEQSQEKCEAVFRPSIASNNP